jgi:hypothetical protein
MPTSAYTACLEALEPRLAPAGIVAVNVKGGALTLTGDTEGNVVEIHDVGGGQWAIRDATDSGTTFSLNGAAAQAEVLVTVTKGIKVDLKEGDDILTLEGITIGGPVTLKDKAGNDTVNFFNTVVMGSIKLDTGADTDTVNANGNTFQSTLSLKMGTGDDQVVLKQGTYGGITADLGTGLNYFDLMDHAPDAAISVFGDVSITSKGTAESSDDIYLGAENFLIVGSLKVKFGLYDSLFSLNEIGDHGNALITGNLSYQSGGSINTVSLIKLGANITIGGKADFKMGKGDSHIEASELEQLTLGSLSYTGSAGNNEINVEAQSVTISRNVLINMSASKDYNVARFEVDTSLFIGGNLTYKGSKGITDGLQINVEHFRVLGGFNYNVSASLQSQMAIDCITGSLGSVLIKGGNGRDQVYLGEGNGDTESLHILGKMDVNLGKTGSNQIRLLDTIIHGKASITASTDSSDEESAFLTIGIGDSTFLSSLTIKTSGTVGAEIGLSNSTFHAAVNLTTGTGDDRVYLDNDEVEYGDRAAKNLFEGPVKIILGGGNDQLFAGSVGGGPNGGNTFNGTILFDGGTGVDLNDTAATNGNVYNGKLTEKNFEPVPA